MSARPSTIFAPLALFLSAPPVYAQGAHELWSQGRAATLPRGRVEASLYGPIKVAVGDDSELSMSPLRFPMMPHGGLKIAWADGFPTRARVASWHQVSYTGSLYDSSTTRPTGHVPLSTSHGVLVEQRISPQRSLTLGVTLRATEGIEDATLRAIPSPFTSPSAHLMHLRTGWSVGTHARWRARLSKHIGYWSRVELVSTPQGHAVLGHAVIDHQWARVGRLELGARATWTDVAWRAPREIVPYVDVSCSLYDLVRLLR